MSITVYGVKTAVVAGLSEALDVGGPTALADIVRKGLPANVPPSGEPRRVYVLNVVNEAAQPAYEGGSTVREETYVVPIVVECLSITGNDPDGYDTAEGLAATIVAAIDAQTAADPEWGGACHGSGLSLQSEVTQPLQDNSGWISRAILQLHIQRRGR